MVQTGGYWESGHYNRMSERHKLPSSIRAYQRAEEDAIRRCITLESDILEVGSGTGRILRVLQDDARQLVGLDCALRMIEEAGKTVSKVELVQGDAFKMPFRGDSFDYVLCLFNTLGNFSGKPAAYVGEMSRVVRGGGQILLSVYSEDAVNAQRELYRSIGLTIDEMKADRVILKEGFHSRRFTEDGLRSMLSARGLQARVERLTRISYLATGRK